MIDDDHKMEISHRHVYQYSMPVDMEVYRDMMDKSMDRIDQLVVVDDHYDYDVHEDEDDSVMVLE